MVPGVIEWKELFAVKTRAGAEFGSWLNDRSVVWWTAADVTDANAHAIARHAAQSDSYQHVANVVEVVVQTHDHRRYAGKIGNTAGVFHCEWILNVIGVFGAGGDARRCLTGKEGEISGEQHHARTFVYAEAHGRRDRKWFLQPRG